MKFTAQLAALALAVTPAVFGQDILFDLAHNATTIIGTWSTGSRNVVTGPGFATPATTSFKYPLTTGVSYSFSDAGFYESARYRFNGNGSAPNCITGIIGWHHGTYTLENNGSIVLTPFGDGYQQIQNPCPSNGVSNFIENFDQVELLRSWRIFLDATDGPKLHLFGFDGTPVAPMFSVSKDAPIMLPTQKLRNVTAPLTLNEGLFTRELKDEQEESAAAGLSVRAAGVAAAALGMSAVALIL